MQNHTKTTSLIQNGLLFGRDPLVEEEAEDAEDAGVASEIRNVKHFN